MELSEIKVVEKPLVLTKPKEIDAFESRYWIRFPNGYRDYITTFGEGALSETVRIYPPYRIEKDLNEWRQRINKYWFWDKGRRHLPKERALECFVIGDTTIGDEIVFHPTRPEKIFILPRDSEQIFDTGSDLLLSIQWILSSGKLLAKVKEREFRPFDSRKISSDSDDPEKKIVDPEGESLDNLIEVGRKWVSRHAVHKLALKDLREKYRGAKTTLIRESIVLNGEYPLKDCYVVYYRLNDASSDSELGTFIWHYSGDSYGYQMDRTQKK